MKRIFEKLYIVIRTWLWNRKRENSRVVKRRMIYPNGKLTLYPYETDYDSLINEYCKHNRYNLPKLGKYTNVYTYLFCISKQNGKIMYGFPIKLSNNLLTLRAEKQEPDGYHTALAKEFSIYLFDIEHISALRDSDNCNPLFVEKPISGYKAIPEENGKLITYDCTYVLNEKKKVSIICSSKLCYCFCLCSSLILLP